MPLDFGKNYFDLFGLAPSFQLDTLALEQHYREIQLQVHPDKFAHAADADRRLSMQWATYVNEAYQALKHPLSRARYLLQINGVDTEEESNTAMPAEFLMQQMEWREAIVEAEAANDIDALERLAAKLRAESRSLQARLTEALDVGKDYTAAAGSVRMMKFLEKLGEEINRVLDALET